MTAAEQSDKVCHPIVVVKVNGITCRALLDTGATVSYASGYILDRLKLAPKHAVTRRIQTIVGIVTKKIEVYDLTISDTKGDCVIPVHATRVGRGELLSINNPSYEKLIRKYPHLSGVEMEDTDTKSILPVYIILGASEYVKIKTHKPQRTGKMGWSLMSSGAEADADSMLLAQTATTDYERLCRLDVLGLEDKSIGDQNVVHDELREQLQRSPEGWSETALPWKGDHPPLPNNKAGSLRRLGSLAKRLEKTERLDQYDAIIQEQLEQGVVEVAEMPATGREFYIPHKAVVREYSQTTKMRIVYDASSKASEDSPSLNDCLETGPPNKLWKVLVRRRFYPVALLSDIRKAFLQVRIRAQDRDALRFHWLHNKDPKQIRTLRFTRALFGLAPSPFLLGGVIQQHLDACRAKYLDGVKDIERGLYVDDLVSGGETVGQVRQKKLTFTEIFRQATFTLHKWNSNEQELALDETSKPEDSPTYAKQQLGGKDGEHSLG